MSVRLAVLARAPVAGRAKTRLIPALGASGAAALHAALVRDTVARAVAAGVGPVELWAADDPPGPFLEALAGEHGLALRRQPDGDLGARMAAALGAGGAGAGMVIGTDCPALGPDDLRTAAVRLADRDAVIAPALDGGYVLLGLHRVEPVLFHAIAWGTDRVLATTRQRLAGLGWDWSELEPRADVDRPEDLAAVAGLGPDWAWLCRGADATADVDQGSV